ncbi:MAG: ThuA domain-containing protein [Roseibium sp.]|uniref:ThuA domain-containing protein n=1 Tax=Roseibium sp. TaxID=1936156 RepID=UPI001AFE8316|nr:ThuA domain-containing protein [Roseibium sp.]MBO6893855.1 ThuA domain-containing protein [Roseibium sp.]MBO6932632.1 ThuA domain-containing protein [Roseibium sp.]
MSNKKAFIFWGGWDGHTPVQCAELVKDMLQANGFEVEIEEGTGALARAPLTDFDLIVPIITMSTIEKKELTNLLSAIRSGTGLAGFHGQMGDSFRNEPEYQFMVGGQWVAHPGDIIDYKVRIRDVDDPIVAGLSDFAYRSEQYYMHVDPSIEVLATTVFENTEFEEINGVEMPVVWKRRYGKGRVFYSSLGHVADEFKVPQMRTLFERGALWAAR